MNDETPKGLSAVPDIGEEGVEPVALEEAEVTDEQVEALFNVLEAQNQVLIDRLAILGRGINPLVLLKIQVDTLIDFVMGDEDARAQYNTACSMRLNETLKLTYAQLVGAEVPEP